MIDKHKHFEFMKNLASANLSGTEISLALYFYYYLEYGHDNMMPLPKAYNLLNEPPKLLQKVYKELVDYRGILKLVFDHEINDTILTINYDAKSWQKGYRPKKEPIRELIFFRDNYTCQYCGLKFDQRFLHIDHVIPKCKNGSDREQNLVTACANCNMQKNGTDLVQFIDKYGLWNTISDRIKEKLNNLELYNE